jgi:hypothetical protein
MAMRKDLRVLILKGIKYTNLEQYEKDKGVSVEVINDNLKCFYDKIGCQYIDIVIRNVGGKKYCFVHDESGAYQDDVVYTAVCPHNPLASIPGTCIITGPADSNGDLTSLTNTDIRNLVTRLAVAANDEEATSFTPVMVLD